MEKIKSTDLSAAYDYIKNNCDGLYKTLFEYYFFEGESSSVIRTLKQYQNKDGGFGHGLEPDFLLPNSSPMATTIAFQILDDIEDPDLIKDAVRYYEKTFDKNRNGWWSVPSNVNEYPHAPWWSYNVENKCTIIDKNWGNPSAEIIGFMCKWEKYVKEVEIIRLLDYSIEHLNSLEKFESEHEVYCYIRMFKNITITYQDKIRNKLSTAIKELICLDETKWDSYVPMPLDFVKSKNHPLFVEVKDYADNHCNYLTATINNGVWSPTWEWNDYEVDWEKSKRNWTAIITIKNYRILKEFDRID